MAIRLWGNEKLVNTTTSNGQSSSVVAALANGSFVTAWVDDMGAGFSVVKFQRFDAFGNTLGVETVLPVADGEGDQIKPSIAALADGGFVIAVQDMDPSVSATYADVRVLRFDSSGVQVAELDIPSPVPATDPTVVASGSGYEVAYSLYYTATDTDPYITRVSSSNVPGSAISPDTSNANHQLATVSLRDASNLHLYYTSGGIVIMNRIDASGTVYPNVLVAPALSSFDFRLAGLSAVKLSDVYFAVGVLIEKSSGSPLFRSEIIIHDSGGTILSRQTVGSAGNPVQFQVLGDGTFVAVYDQPGVSGNDVFIQQFSTSGAPLGAPLPVAEGTVEEIRPDVSRLADGRLVVTWTDNSGSDGSGSGIFQRTLDPREGLVTGSNDALTAETLIGNDSFNDHILGRAGNDAIYGLAGADVIYGGEGLDTLYGGRGDDTMYGGADRDTMFGELGNDELYGEAGLDLMRGGDGNDTLSGGADNDSMYAEGDNDTLIGGVGMDYLEGGAGFDLASYETALQGIRVDMVFRSGNTFDAIGDTFVNVEGLKGSNFDDFLTSTYGDDTIYGLDGADYINARSGNDTLFGGAGIDQIYAGDGNDILEGGAGADYLDGGNNTDTASYANAGNGVRVDMINQGTNTNEAAGDFLYQIENLTGSILNDFLLGDNNANTLSGGDSDDELTGRGGIDTLLGGQGADTLIGGLGNDIMDGGGDADIFRYDSATFNADTINNFQDGLDTFNMAGSGLSFASFTITQSGADTLMTAAGGNTITLTGFTAANITGADFL